MKWVIVTGPDACGKDTQIQKMEQYFSAQGLRVQTLTIWDSLQDFAKVTDAKTLMNVTRAFLKEFSPEARSHFLMSNLLNSFSKAKPKNDFVIVNGFSYKYWASEMAYGVEGELWREFTDKQCPKPDYIFYLDLPFETAKERRTEWSDYEMGECRSKLEEPLRLAQFQTKMNGFLKEIISMQNNAVTIDADASVDSITKTILGYLA